MVPAIMVLTFAWTLKSMTDSLGAATYVAGLVQNIADNAALMSFIPAIVFVVGAFLAFATGTSWGTFGILIPIVVNVFGGNLNNELMIISISACMAGAVDHVLPVPDPNPVRRRLSRMACLPWCVGIGYLRLLCRKTYRKAQGISRTKPEEILGGLCRRCAGCSTSRLCFCPGI